MSVVKVEKLFGSEDLSLPVEIPAGFKPGGKALEGSLEGATNVALFGREVELGGSLEATARRLKKNEALSFFSTSVSEGEMHAPPGDMAFTELVLGGGAAVAGAASTVQGPLVVALEGKAEARIGYRCVQPVPSRTSTKNALKSLGLAVRAPGRVRLGDLEPGVFHRYTFRGSADLGLKVEAGWDQAITRSLFDDLSSDVSFEYQAALQASFGVSLLDTFSLAVGRLGAETGDYVRVRLERRHERKLSFGALFSLQVRYDLGGLASIIDKLFAETGAGPLFDGAREYSAKIGDIVAALEAGDKVALSEALTDKAVTALGALAGVDDFVAEVTSPDRARQLAATLKGLTDAYDEIDGRLQSLWDRVLGYADVGPGSAIRRALEDLAKLEQATSGQMVDSLIRGDAKRAVDLVEILCGMDLESLLISDSLERRIREVGAKAAQALGFLDKLTIEGALGRIDEVTAGTGITQVVDWIRTNATTTADLDSAIQELVDEKLKTYIGRLVGKAVDLVDESDLKALTRLAETLGDFSEIDKRLKKRFENLEGEIGFSVGVEIERVSFESSLLDIELDPKNTACENAWARLRTGDVRGFLRELPKVDDTKGRKRWPYFIREGLFTSRRIRSSAVSLFFSLLGTESDARRRMTEARTVLDQSGRRATYSGGLTTTHRRRGWSWTGGAWLVAEAASPDLDLDARFDALDLKLRLVGTREDESTTASEMVAISRLLSDLGFVGGGVIKDLPVPARVPTRLSFNLELGSAALAEVVAGLDSATKAELNASEEWDLDFLNAASRWFDSGLVDTSLKSAAAVLAGPVLSRAVTGPEYRDVWRLGAGVNLSVDGVPIDSQSYPEIGALGRARGIGVRRLKTAHGVFLEARRHKRPADLFRLSGRFARAAGAATPHFWANPTFLTWLVLARLTRRKPQLLSEIQGVASFRWQDAAEEWREPVLFRLDLGVPQHPLGNQSIFPLES